MSEYTERAKKFLENCNATMTIAFAGLEKPVWDDKPHCTYDCTITTPRGKMSVHFYDHLIHTEIVTMSPKKWYEKKTHRLFDGLRYAEQQRFIKQFYADRKNAVPSEYDILACLQTYDVGNMDDFMCELGYEIKCTADITNFINTYNDTVREYNDVRRCFTEKQIEALQEIL